MLFLAGGTLDPNINTLEKTCLDLGVEYERANWETSKFYWDIGNNIIKINDFDFSCSSVFSRWDVFGEDMEESAVFHDTIMQAATTYGKKILNKNYNRQVTKVFNLVLAKNCGFTLPDTYIVGNLVLKKDGEFITKPVRGGSYAKEYNKEVNLSFVQQKLESPDLRIYRIGSDFISFNLFSDHLDYRTDNEVKIKEVKIRDFDDRLKTLSNFLGLNYCCIDLKKDKTTDEYLFLEINSSPMFSEFDKIAEGKLSKAIIRNLINADQEV